MEKPEPKCLTRREFKKVVAAKDRDFVKFKIMTTKLIDGLLKRISKLESDLRTSEDRQRAIMREAFRKSSLPMKPTKEGESEARAGAIYKMNG